MELDLNKPKWMRLKEYAAIATKMVFEGREVEAVAYMKETYLLENPSERVLNTDTPEETVSKVHINYTDDFSQFAYGINNSESMKKALINTLFCAEVIYHHVLPAVIESIQYYPEKLNVPLLDIWYEKHDYSPKEWQRVYAFLATVQENIRRYHQNIFTEKLEQTYIRAGWETKNKKFEIYEYIPEGEYLITDIEFYGWRLRDEYNELSSLGITKFPKTFQTFQKHKESNSSKYQEWIAEAEEIKSR